jgi:GNAT superfamily N-acetyltransferase
VIFAALSEAADRGELLLVDCGLCRFHRRRDGVVVVREILVTPPARRCGVGRRMVAEVQRRHPGATLLARCPVADARGTVAPGNVFWAHLGFALARVEGRLNVWERRCG